MHAFFFSFSFFALIIKLAILAIEMELDTDLLASYLRVSLVCYLLLLLAAETSNVRTPVQTRHIGLYCITSYMNSNNNNRHMHACLVCELLASYMHVAHSFPVRIPYMNLTAVKFMGSLGFQHTELHLSLSA